MWCNTDPKLRFELLKLVITRTGAYSLSFRRCDNVFNGRQQVVLKMWSLLLKVENKTDI